MPSAPKQDKTATIVLEFDIGLLKQMFRQRTLHVSDIRCRNLKDKILLQQLLLQAIVEDN